jgi:hypothetical protein
MNLSENSMIFLGCSYTSGAGLTDQNQCYTAIMCKQLNKEEVNLAYGGASNYSSFDTLSKLQLVPNAALILQITYLARIKYYNHDLRQIKDRILASQPDRVLINVYTDEFLLYELDRYLYLITKYTKSAGINLVIWDIANTFGSTRNRKIKDCLTQFKEYVYLPSDLNKPDSYRIDNGTDGQGKSLGSGHPGPESHKLIASKLVDHYTTLYQ